MESYKETLLVLLVLLFEESSRGTNEGNSISFTEEQEGADDNVQDEELIQEQVEAQDECWAALVPEDDGVQDEELIQVQDQVDAQDECCATIVPEDGNV